MKKYPVIIAMLVLQTVMLFAQYPSVSIGVGLQPVMGSETADPSEILFAVLLDGEFSYRSRLGETGYISFLAEGNGGLLQDSISGLFDKEAAVCEIGLTGGPGRWIFQLGLESSFEGTIFDNPYTEPTWQLSYDFSTERDQIQPFVTLVGNWQNRPSDDEDIFFQGAEIGFRYSPDVLSEYSVRLGGGWEYWYEYPLYSFGGSQSDEARYDIVGVLSAKAGGLYDFFLQWDVELEVLLRFSNANRYIAALSFYEETSENNIEVSLKPSAVFSLNRYVNISLFPAAGITYYFARQALSAAPLVLDENVYIVKAGGRLHFDWTPNNLLYFILELEGRRDISNDAEMDQWIIQGKCGVKLRF